MLKRASLATCAAGLALIMWAAPVTHAYPQPTVSSSHDGKGKVSVLGIGRAKGEQATPVNKSAGRLDSEAATHVNNRVARPPSGGVARPPSGGAEGSSSSPASGRSQAEEPVRAFDPVLGYHGINWLYRGEVLKMTHIPDPECFVGNKYICWGPAYEPSRGVPMPGLPDSANGQALTPPPPTREMVESWAYQVRVLLHIPTPALRVGPDPTSNDWDMAVVGYPLWFWSDEPAQLSTSVQAFGYAWSITADRAQTTIDFGDGTSIDCSKMDAYPGDSAVGQASPSCGHTYEEPSLPQGSYTVTATSHWNIAWQGGGYSGTYVMDRTDSIQLPVGELHSLGNR